MGYCHLVPPPVLSWGRAGRRSSWDPISLTFLALGEASPGSGGAEAAEAEGSVVGRAGSWGFVEVGAHTTNVHPPGSKESPIAWLVAIWSPVVLGTSRGKSIA